MRSPPCLLAEIGGQATFRRLQGWGKVSLSSAPHELDRIEGLGMQSEDFKVRIYQRSHSERHGLAGTRSYRMNVHPERLIILYQEGLSERVSSRENVRTR